MSGEPDQPHPGEPGRRARFPKSSTFLRSSTGRFTLFQLALGAAVAGAVFLTFAFVADRLLLAEIRDIVTDDVRVVERAAAAGGVEAAAEALGGFAGPSADPRIVGRLESRDGTRKAGNLADWPPTVLADGTWRPVQLFREGRETSATFGVRAVTMADGSRLLMGRELDEPRALISTFLKSLALALLVMLLMGVAVGMLHAARVFGRLEELADVMRRAATGERTARVSAEGAPDEFGLLATEINQLLDAQQAHIADMRMITDSLAHDIRGPLSRIRQAAEAAGEGALPRIEREAALLLSMTTTLLDTTRARSGIAREQFERLDLSLLVEDVAELFEPAAADAGRTLAWEVEPGLELEGHPQLLPQALSNLIENALRHGGGGIGIEARRAEGAILLTVSDAGAGIAPDDRARAVQPFVRLDPSRSGPGSGVGLALVASVAVLHGGELLLEDNQPGLRAVLRLPDDAE